MKRTPPGDARVDKHGCTIGAECTPDEFCLAHRGRAVSATEKARVERMFKMTPDEILADSETRSAVMCKCGELWGNHKFDDKGWIVHAHPMVGREGKLGEVIDRRVQVYGNPTDTFVRIAQVWSGILGHEVLPVEVPLLMAGMKMVRAQIMPDYSDNSDDIAGYMDIFTTLVGEDMIHARNVSEFIAQKWPEQ